jgi:hypothetical protein
VQNLAGYVVTGVVSLAVGFLLRRLEPKAKLVFWSPHNFLFELKKENVVLQTNSLTLQNVGRKPAEGIEVIHKARPDFFQFSPAVDYEERSSPTGEHVLAVKSLGAKEYFTLQLLSYKTAPVLLTVRSKEGLAAPIAIKPQRVFPRWFNIAVAFLFLVGLGFTIYWVVRSE